MHSNSNDIIIMMPIYNDWISVNLLCNKIDEICAKTSHPLHILLINDGSTEKKLDGLSSNNFKNIKSISILNLRRNLGHQRAIAIGLCYIEDNLEAQSIVIMDGDGEDSATDIPLLISSCIHNNNEKIIFAERSKRSENVTFKIFYSLYKSLHLILTGQKVRVGNFSIIPKKQVTRIVIVSDLWNHYAASVFKARLPIDTIHTIRARRLDGKSQMNFTSLIIHGLSAMSVYGDKIGVRLLVALSIASTTLILSLIILYSLNSLLGLHISQYINWALISILLLIPQIFFILLIFVFLILSGRDSSSFLPIRDYHYYISDFITI